MPRPVLVDAKVLARRLDDLPPEWATALMEVATFPEAAWVPRKQLALTVGRGTLAALVAGGWLAVWEGVTGGPLVTLTPWGAARLGLGIAERGYDEQPYWSDAPDAEHLRPAGRPMGMPTIPYPDALPDTGPRSVLDALVAEEERKLRELLAAQEAEEKPLTLMGAPVKVDRKALIRLAKASSRGGGKRKRAG